MRENNHTNFVLVHLQQSASNTHTHTHTHTQTDRERKRERENVRARGASSQSSPDVILVLRELSFSFRSVSNTQPTNEFSFPRRKSPLEY